MEPLNVLYEHIKYQQFKVREYTPKVDSTDLGRAYSTIIASHQSTIQGLTIQANLQIQANLSTLSACK